MSTKWHCEGGDTMVWLGATKDNQAEIQTRWSHTIDPSNLFVYDLKLKPIWKVLIKINKSKGLAVKNFLEKKWKAQGDSWSPRGFSHKSRVRAAKHYYINPNSSEASGVKTPGQYRVFCYPKIKSYPKQYTERVGFLEFPVAYFEGHSKFTLELYSPWREGPTRRAKIGVSVTLPVENPQHDRSTGSSLPRGLGRQQVIEFDATKNKCTINISNVVNESKLPSHGNVAIQIQALGTTLLQFWGSPWNPLCGELPTDDKYAYLKRG